MRGNQRLSFHVETSQLFVVGSNTCEAQQHGWPHFAVPSGQGGQNLNLHVRVFAGFRSEADCEVAG